MGIGLGLGLDVRGSSRTLGNVPDAPVVTAPAANADIYDGIAVTLTATVTAGQVPDRIDFLLDGSTVIASDAVAPYSQSWTPSGVSAGAHTITARYFYGSGTRDSAAVSVVLFDETVLPGLVALFHAGAGVTLNGSRVSAWADQSGTGDSNKNLAQATAGKQPLFNAASANLNNQPSFTFSKARFDLLSSGTWSTPLPNNSSMFLVGRVTSRHGSGYSVGIAATAGGIAIDAQPGSAMLITAGTILSSTGIVPDGTNVVCGGTFDGANGKLYLNAQTANASGAVGAGTLDVMNVGDTAGSTNPWDGEIARIAAFAPKLSAGNAARLMLFHGAKYGITIGA
jgi:hypothetical protein